MTFLPAPKRYNRDEMVAEILAIPETGMKPNPNTGEIWKPLGATWHNTDGPTIKEWTEEYTQVQKDSWGANYDTWVKNTQHWHSGPHFVCPPETWSEVLCDLQADGIHCTCDNEHFYGVETVGNFAPGAEDPLTGFGAIAVGNAANVIAALCVRFNWTTANIRFHRDCPRDGHPCPGALLTNEHAFALVDARIAEIKAGIAQGKFKVAEPIASDTPTVVIPSVIDAPPEIMLPEWPTLTADPAFFTSAATVYNEWKDFGASNVVAWGFVANVEAEDAFNIGAVGDKGTAFGIHQWHENRVEHILAETGINVRTASLTDQVHAAQWEIATVYPKAWVEIEASTTAEQAAQLICKLYEGAGAPNATERRGKMAERWAVFAEQNPGVFAPKPLLTPKDSKVAAPVDAAPANHSQAVTVLPSKNTDHVPVIENLMGTYTFVLKTVETVVNEIYRQPDITHLVKAMTLEQEHPQNVPDESLIHGNVAVLPLEPKLEVGTPHKAITIDGNITVLN